MTQPRPIDDAMLRRVQARSGATRRAVLDRLAVAPAGVAVLAAELAIHPNAVRQHLAVLHAAGLVVAEIDHGAARVGRPRAVYRAVADGVVTPNPFERLAALLVDVAAGRDPMEIGTAEGVARAGAISVTDPATAVALVAAGSGFAVELGRRGETARVELTRCPFAALAGTVVCELHRGIVEGAAHAAGGSVRAFEVRDPASGPCVVHVREEKRER